MQASKIIISTVLSVALLSIFLVVPAVAASDSSSGNHFADYAISATGPYHSISANVNETITPSSMSGFSTISLEVVSSMSNFSYSKVVNSSMAMFPIVPSIGNQSFTYSTHNISISASISKTGTGSATIGGTTYTTTNYSFTVSGSKNDGTMSMSANGQLSTLPSGLLYSAVINGPNSTTVNVKLVGTNLSLNSTSQSSNTTGMAIVGGASTLAVAGVGAFVFFRRKNKNSGNVNNSPGSGSESEEKPLYKVD